jgi:SAM-dependent methyltransferase
MRKYFKAATKRIKNHFNKFFLKGDKVFCKVCNWNGKYFPNNRCPNCSSWSRTRLIPFSIKYFSIPKENIKILHIAPNKNEYNYINDSFEFDIYDRLDLRKYEHINIVRDLKNTNLDSNHYDLIIAWHVLEHIPDDLNAIIEMKRILKIGGNMLISVPIFPKNNSITYEDINIKREDFLKIHGHDDHCRSCGFDYYKRFENLGFKTETLINKTLSDTITKQYGLSKNHRVWKFTK